MIKTTLPALAVFAACAAPVRAGDYSQYPSMPPIYRFERSIPTGRAVAIPPYRRAFPIRVYAVPPQPPFYNVPPYAVISPY